MEPIGIYLGGGLFNAGERLHNLTLEKALYTVATEREIEIDITLPQRKALERFIPEEERFDVKGIVSDCYDDSKNPKKLLIGNIDGADADSGTSFEEGVAINSKGEAIVYRTDFRTDLEKEVGINAMLMPEGAVLVYEPCFFTELDQVDTYYTKLANKILDKVLELKRKE